MLRSQILGWSNPLLRMLEIKGYCISSAMIFSLTNNRDLAKAIRIACQKEEKAWGGHNTSFATIVDSVVGYEEDVRARLD
jgi:beta-1,4-N-acetylglucosaminyltransferase